MSSLCHRCSNSMACIWGPLGISHGLSSLTLCSQSCGGQASCFTIVAGTLWENVPDKLRRARVCGVPSFLSMLLLEMGKMSVPYGCHAGSIHLTFYQLRCLRLLVCAVNNVVVCPHLPWAAPVCTCCPSVIHTAPFYTQRWPR